VRLGFFLAEAFGSMRRNWVMAMAAVITVFISTFILGAVLVTRDNLNQGATSLKNRVLIEVFIRDDASDEEKQTLGQKIEALKASGEVKSYKYISKEEALRRQPAAQPAARQLRDPGQRRQPGRRGGGQVLRRPGGGQRPGHPQRRQVRA